MDGKIKMPEKLAEILSKNEAEMIFFDSLSFDEKKLYIQTKSSDSAIRIN